MKNEASRNCSIHINLNKIPDCRLNFFRPPTLLKILLRRIKALFLGEKSSSQLLQNISLGGKKIFQNQYHLIRHLLIRQSSKFFFPKTNKLVYLIQEFLFQSHCTVNLLQFGERKFSNSEPSDFGNFQLPSKRGKTRKLTGCSSFKI